MGQMEDMELLRAATAVAMADGELRRSEMGLLRGLADRVGVGQVSFDAMIGAAESGALLPENILISDPERAKTALELLVAQARMDGEISPQEREILVRIASALRINGEAFTATYESGIRKADQLRRRRTT
jgi:tellurite resistance protein